MSDADADVVKKDRFEDSRQMKLIPLITAILVTGFLYFLVFERDERDARSDG
jgi:hypothetical protein